MKKIQEIHIKGFKSIRDASIKLSALNVIVGANGAGKSNFIEIFKVLSVMVLKNLSTYILEHGGADAFLHNGAKETSTIETHFRFDSDNKNISNDYAFELKPTVEEQFLVSELRRYGDTAWRSYGASSFESRLEDFRAEKSVDGLHNGVGHFIYESIANWQVYHFHDTTKNAPMRRSSSIDDCKKLRGDAANIAAFLFNLKNRSSDSQFYNQIVNAIRVVLPFFDDFTLDKVKMGDEEKIKLSWKQKGSDYPMQAYHLSDGSIRFICLAVALLQPCPPSTIVIDEPELGLHPEAIRVLASLVENAATRTQVIVATQSPLFLDHFSVNDIIIVRRKEGASIFERLDENDYTHWLEEYSVGELWTKNVIMGGTSHE